MPNAKEICGWYEQLRNDRSNFDEIADEIIDHGMVLKRNVRYQRSPGEKKTDALFDGTLGNSIIFKSQFIHGSIMNESTAWYELKHRNADLNKKTDNASWLHDTTRKMLLGLSQSNYYSECLGWITDLAAFGTAAKLNEETPQSRKGLARVMTTALPFGSYVLAEGPDNQIDTIIRQLTVKARECKRRWGDKTPEWISKLVENGKDQFRDVSILHAIFPRDAGGYTPAKLRNPKTMPWASCWIDFEKKQMIDESGYPEFPVSVARMNVIAGEVYGRSAEVALPFQKTLDQAIKNSLVEWAKTLDPPTKQLQGSVVGNISHRPGRNTILKRMDGLELMDKELRQGNRLHEFNVELTRNEIEKIFFIKEIRGLISSESPNPQKTAFEVEKRFRLLYQMLGPNGINLVEALRSDIDTFFAIMLRADMFAEAPEDFTTDVERDGKETTNLDVAFVGPLAKYQRNEELQSIQEGFQDTVAIGQVYPEIYDTVDFDKMHAASYEIRGIQHYLRDEKEVKTIRDQKADKAKLEAEFAAGGAIAEGIGKAGPGLKALSEAQGQRQAA